MNKLGRVNLGIISVYCERILLSSFKGGDFHSQLAEINKTLKSFPLIVDKTEPGDIGFDTIIVDLCCHPNRDIVAAGSIDGDVTIHSYSLEGESHQLLSFQNHKKACRALSFSPDGNKLFSVSKDKSLQCINVDKGSVCANIKKAHSEAIYCLLVVDENIVATGDDDGFLKVWDMRRNTSVMEVKENEEYLSDMVINEKKKTLVASSGEGTVTAFDIRKHKMKMQSELFDSELMCLAPMKHEEKLVVGDGEGVLNIFNWGEWGNISDRFPGHPMSVDCMVPLSKDVVVTGSMDGIIRAVHIVPNRFLGVVGQHEEFPVENLSKSHCGRFVASCSHDQKIKFWNVEDIGNKKVHASKKPKKKLKTQPVGKSVAKDNFFADLDDTDRKDSTDSEEDNDSDNDDDDDDELGHSDDNEESNTAPENNVKMQETEPRSDDSADEGTSNVT